MKTPATYWPTLSRIAAALLGGYVFTYAFTAALARLLPMGKTDALIVSSLPAFMVYSLTILWAFGCRNVWRAWAGVALAVPLGVIGFWPQLSGVLG
ncbi:hypothetical protein D3C76_233130 [compost metagenome]